MNERYMVQGKRLDDGETVQGYYAFIPKSNFCAHDRHLMFVVGDDQDDLDCELVDPATVEPVAVKPVVNKNTWQKYCPNCNVLCNNPFAPRAEYCGKCGQRLDWRSSDE